MEYNKMESLTHTHLKTKTTAQIMFGQFMKLVSLRTFQNPLNFISYPK